MKGTVIGIILIAIGLVLSFVIPMAIFGERYIDLPPSQEPMDGIPFSATMGTDTGPQQYFFAHSDAVIDNVYFGVYLDTDAFVPANDGIRMLIALASGQLESDQDAYVCAMIDANDIPSGQVSVMKAKVSEVHTKGEGGLSCNWDSNPADISFRVYENIGYIMYPVGGSAIIPGFFWQFSTVTVNEWQSYYMSEGQKVPSDKDFSFILTIGREPDEPPPDEPPDEQPPEDIDDEDVAVVLLIIGPLLFATGVIFLIYDTGYFKTSLMGYGSLAIIWLIAFGFLFYLANYGVV